MLRTSLERLGDLNCRVACGGDASPDRALILCHGFGAPGTDLVPLAEAICSMEPALVENTLFVFPEAPLQPPEFEPFGGRAWWPLDMVRMQAAIQRGEFRDLRQDQPERLPAARAELTSVLDQVQHGHQLALDRIVVGGFSQGSMLATDVVLRLPESPAALVVYSGTLLSEPEWTRLAPKRSGLTVLQSHGSEDPILPFEAAEWLRDLFTSSGLEVEFQTFRGGHTITAPAVQSTAALLKKLD